MKSVSDYSVEVEKTLQAIDYPAGDLASLYEPIAYSLSAGGKRLRPVLTLMAAEAFGGDMEKALTPAAGMEMFHNFTLLHDDVMDNSDVRRGRPSVHAKFGVNSAILSGDTMLTLATQMVAEVDDAILRRVLDCFNAMAVKVYEGQRLDMDFETAETVDPEKYIEMIIDKTGALLGAAAAIGAMIGGASEKDCAKMQEFGEMLGVAFQIQDDWLDTFGDASTFGKPIGGDIVNRKKTYLYVSATNRTDVEAQALKTAFAIESPEMRVKTVTRIYEKMGMSEDCRKAVAQYSSKALTALKKTSLSEEWKDAFRKVAEKLIGRKK